MGGGKPDPTISYFRPDLSGCNARDPGLERRSASNSTAPAAVGVVAAADVLLFVLCIIESILQVNGQPSSDKLRAGRYDLS
jgi:hypothetical protein